MAISGEFSSCFQVVLSSLLAAHRALTDDGLGGLIIRVLLGTAGVQQLKRPRKQVK